MEAEGFVCWLTWDLITWKILTKRRKNIVVHYGANVWEFSLFTPDFFLGFY